MAQLWMINLQGDLIKTDINSPFEKGQFSLETNYFLNQKVALGLGYEYRTEGVDYFTLGGRYYFLSFVFTRARILFSDSKTDYAFALGYKYFLDRRWRLEVIPEVYFNNPEFALRIGAAYVFTK